jgi:hypothetical protein
MLGPVTGLNGVGLQLQEQARPTMSDDKSSPAARE